MEEKPKNPYASLKAAKRGQTSKAAVGSSILYHLQAKVADISPKAPKIRIPRVVRSIEGREDASKNETVAKKTAVMKEAAIPSKKRKADEDLEQVSAAVKEVAKEATSTIYKKRRVDAEPKAAVADTKPVESEASVSLGKKRKAAHAFEDDTAEAVVRGQDAPSAKKRRGEDWPIVKTRPLEETMTMPSGEKKAKTVKDDEVFDPQDIHTGLAHEYPQGLAPSKPVISPAQVSTPKAPTKRMPWMNKTSGWGRVSVIASSIKCHLLTEKRLQLSLPK